MNDLNQSQQDVLEKNLGISKAYTTGHEVDPAQMEDGSALRYEFLDDQIAMLTWTEGDLTFYKDIAKVTSQSTVAEYDVFKRHGQVGPTRFVSEIGVSPVSDPNIERKTVPMKFISDTKQVSLAATIVNNVQAPEQLLLEDAIANVAKTIEWASFYGDASLTHRGGTDQGLEFDGLEKLIAESNVLDVRGEVLTQEILNQGATLVSKGYGTPTDAYMPIGVQSEFINRYLEKQVQLTQDNSDNVNLGFRVQGFYSSRGHIKLHGSTVMELDNILDESVRAMPNAPRKPEVEGTIVDPEVAGRFNEEDVENGLEYAVTVSSEELVGLAGKSEVIALTDETKGVELTIQVDGYYGATPEHVSIYRKSHATGQFYLIKRLPMNMADGAQVIKFVDTNETIPGTADVFLGEMSPQVINLFELFPMTRLDLARISASKTFTVLWYGALALKAPKKWVHIKNVGYQEVGNPHNPFA